MPKLEIKKNTVKKVKPTVTTEGRKVFTPPPFDPDAIQREHASRKLHPNGNRVLRASECKYS